MKTGLKAFSLVLALIPLSAVADDSHSRRAFLVEVFTCKARVDLGGVNLQPFTGLEADEANPEADDIDRFLVGGFAVTFDEDECDPKIPKNRGPEGFVGVLERIEICGGIDNYRVLHPGEFYKVEHEGQLFEFLGPGVVLHGGPEPVCGSENHDSVLVVQYLQLHKFPERH
jgi:hypothetical protein